MQTLVPYKDEVKNVFIDRLKAYLSGVTTLESLVDDDDEDVDFGSGKSRLDQEARKGKVFYRII